MRALTLILMLAVFAGGTLLLLKQFQPELFSSLVPIGLLDGSGDGGAAEDSRIDSINLLPISEQKKMILIRRTIYMEAPKHYVELALGPPRQKTAVTGLASGSSGERWMYHFEGDAKPTFLVFDHDNKLVLAKRASAHGEIEQAPSPASSGTTAGLSVKPGP